MDQGLVACLAQLTFFNRKPEKRRKAGNAEMQKEEWRTGGHYTSLSPSNISACLQAVCFFFSLGTLDLPVRRRLKKYNLVCWRMFYSTCPLAFGVSSWSSFSLHCHLPPWLTSVVTEITSSVSTDHWKISHPDTFIHLRDLQFTLNYSAAVLAVGRSSLWLGGT